MVSSSLAFVASPPPFRLASLSSKRFAPRSRNPSFRRRRTCCRADEQAWPGESAAAAAAAAAASSTPPIPSAADDAAETVPLLEIRDLRYIVPFDDRKRLFLGANLSLYKHQFIVVVGENGAGKSTLLKLIMGFADSQAGKILWRGEDLRKKKRIRREHMAIVMQRPSDFFLGRTVLEELTLCYDGCTPDDIRSVLASVGLNDISLLKQPSQLSGGQQKRLAIAAQLMRTNPRIRAFPPELFLLDEPMAGVDAAGRRDLARLLHSLTKSFAVFIISHEPNELLGYADRVIQLTRGQLIEVDQDVLAQARRINAERSQKEEPKSTPATE